MTSHQRGNMGHPAILTALCQLLPSLDNTLICHLSLWVSGCSFWHWLWDGEWLFLHGPFPSFPWAAFELASTLFFSC